MEKRKLVKIAFDLQELHLKIGSKLETEVREVREGGQGGQGGQGEDGEVRKFCYYIISGEIKILRLGRAVCSLGPY